MLHIGVAIVVVLNLFLVRDVSATSKQLRASLSVVGATSHAEWLDLARNATSQQNSTATTRARQSDKRSMSGPPCTCESDSKSWTKCARTTPKCVFIDLGAADGNSFKTFLAGGFGALGACPGGKWEAILVEANPFFKNDLQKLAGKYDGGVRSMASTAAYMCEGSTTFHVDTKTYPQYNYWGSSLSNAAGKKYLDSEVKVALANLNRLLYENSIAGDTVIVKMDIEGAEWDILPCLAQSPEVTLLDKLFMEVHASQYSLAGTTTQAFNQAVLALKKQGVIIPNYHSPTL